MVDLPEDQAKASRNAITFSDVRNDYDFFDWTWAAPPPELISHSAPAANVSLRPTTKEFGEYNFGRPAASSIYGGRSSASRHPSQDDSTSHLDSQDFSGIDLNLNFDDLDALDQVIGQGIGQGDVDMAGDEEVEAGRRAARALSQGSERSGIRAESLSKDGSQRMGSEVPFEPALDLGLDFDQFVEQPEGDARRREGMSSSIFKVRGAMSDRNSLYRLGSFVRPVHAPSRLATGRHHPDRNYPPHSRAYRSPRPFATPCNAARTRHDRRHHSQG